MRLRVLATLAIAALLSITLVSNAHADAFRYWGYFQWSDGEWTFAPTGPADTVPADGALEGWRLAVGDTSSTRLPRTGDVFDEICAAATADDDEKRVAVVIDYGTTDDAPDGETPPDARGACAVVPQDASGADVLTAVAEVRFDQGMACGLDGYPATECSSQVDGAAPTDDGEDVTLVLPADAADADVDDPDSETTSDDNRAVALTIGLAIIVLIATGAILQARRSRRR
ncbi:SCO2322 family protein [Phytoactinopolyspora limicola]|uniref:SCO2322 family protein n=1 Tax=Phytoactinopolyspora limicola TaxID=2715536 RepID=UPI001408D33F|nr:SCO2322 family protein [Phytoactinopolyspora limicola]